MMHPRILLGTFTLTLGLSGLAHAGGVPHGEQTSKVETHAASPAHTASVRVSRDRTKQMQRALIARNLYKGPADGVWGPKTESALRNFQTQNGLEPSGELNDATAQALGVDATRDVVVAERQTVSGTDRAAVTTSESANVSATPTARAHGDNSSSIQLQSLNEQQAKEMQQRLQLLGFYRGPIDGRLGEGTRAALSSFFQQQAELARQGVVNSATISLFGTDVNDVQPASGQDTRHPQ